MKEISSKFNLMVLLLLSILLFFTSCSDDSGPGPDDMILDEWYEIDPTEKYSSFKYGGLEPSCSNAPGTVPNFSFFAKKTETSNLVIFFQGGGACWHENNCINDPTYTNAQLEIIQAFQINYFNGILNKYNSANPFSDWNFVYIPYCTGDLHTGARDTTYEKDEIRHRGFVNFQLVMKWISINIKNPEKIFVAGSSAGAYGAALNFPYIKDKYPDATIYVLGDAGNGVIPGSFLATADSAWDIQFHSVFGPNPLQLSVSAIYSIIASTYSDTIFAQFTNAWDGTQSYFYNVMLNIDTPALWDDYSGVQCDWNSNLYALLEDVTEPNYRYYVASGDSHTILLDGALYTDNSGGLIFVDWLSAMLEASVPIDGSSDFQDSECTADCEVPAGLVCSK